MIPFKQRIHSKYLQILQDKIDVFQDMISGLTEDASNDAKGSAGDKHETALSMMHLEQEKLANKLREAIEQKAILEKIDASQIHKSIGIGTLVTTNKLTVYISCALPKITLDDQTIFGISPNSPLGEKLMRKTVGYTFELNSVGYNIISIH
jgi:transcription elongation GreA/GreB family factor